MLMCPVIAVILILNKPLPLLKALSTAFSVSTAPLPTKVPPDPAESVIISSALAVPVLITAKSIQSPTAQSVQPACSKVAVGNVHALSAVGSIVITPVIIIATVTVRAAADSVVWAGHLLVKLGVVAVYPLARRVSAVVTLPHEMSVLDESDKSLFKFSNNASNLARPTLFVPIVKNPPFIIMSPLNCGRAFKHAITWNEPCGSPISSFRQTKAPVKRRRLYIYIAITV